MNLLPLISDSWAFSEKPIEVYEIEELYTPFFEISKEKPESLVNTLEKSNLIHLVEGSRGEGKSCFLRYLAYRLYPTDVFTILLNTFGNSDYSNPNALSEWIIGAISKALENYDAVTDATKKYVTEIMAKKVTLEKGSETSFAAKVGGWFSIIPQILRIEAEASTEIKRTTNTIIEKKYFLQDRVRCLDDLIDIITTKAGFSNVTILIDGIDHMNVEDVSKFTENNFPWLSQINSSVAIVALSEYRINGSYNKNTECARSIRIPRINSLEGLKSFLNRRIKAVDSAACWDKACDEQSTELLFSWYNSKPELITLRKVLRSLNYSASAALNDGTDKIMPYHMALGIKDAL